MFEHAPKAALMGALLISCTCDRTTDNPAPCNLPAGDTTCVSDRQCSDGVWCNGEERCEPGNTDASACGCVRKANTYPCSDDSNCHEEQQQCVLKTCEDGGASSDADGDGASSTACGGDDCDDTNANRFPGASEQCDPGDVDEDCDPSTYGDRDTDGDGYVDAACCNREPPGAPVCGTDCDDSLAGVNRGVPEVCNGVDDNCDGATDEGVAVDLFLDEDGDGHGAGDSVSQCADAPGYSSLGNDCDDTTPSVFPGMIRCTPTYGEYEYCEGSGAWSTGQCTNQGACVPQPGGWAVCSP